MREKSASSSGRRGKKSRRAAFHVHKSKGEEEEEGGRDVRQAMHHSSVRGTASSAHLNRNHQPNMGAPYIVVELFLSHVLLSLVCLARVVAGFYSHPVIFIFLLSSSYKYNPPTTTTNFASGASLYPCTNQAGKLSRPNGSNTEKAKMSTFSGRGKKQCEIWQFRKCRNFSFLRTLESWWKKIFVKSGSNYFFRRKIKFCEIWINLLVMNTKFTEKISFFFLIEGWPPMLFHP